MSLITVTSPHVKGKRKTADLMRWVILATLPGLAAQTWAFGWGNLINVLWCALLAVSIEAIILKLRRRPLGFYLGDYSAVLTGVLLGLALPPLVPWWVSLVAVIAAIIFAKHLYGGMGYNPFNPAMVGFALVLISFPVPMTTHWATPTPLLEQSLGFGDTLSTIFSNHHPQIDSYTMATPLDVYKHEIKQLTAEVVRAKPVFGEFVSLGWEWINLGFLAGGLLLLALRVIPWQTPVMMLAGLSAMSLIFGWDADQMTPLSVHLLSGATMLGAFFIATDPVTSAASPSGRMLYGAGIGILVYIIRSWGGYPDGVAFAVLLMNFAAPLIDLYTQPRTYGHGAAKRGAK